MRRGKKRCEKGKSCGATCIDRREICRKDLPVSASKVAQKVNNRDSAKEEPLVKLDRLETTTDFTAKQKASSGYYSPEIKATHEWVGKLLDEVLPFDKKVDIDPKQEGFFKKLRERFYNSITDGDPAQGKIVAKELLNAVTGFTSSDYGDIRDAQRGLRAPGSLTDEYLKLGKRIEKLIAASETVKPEVEKFRGIQVDKYSLNGMIESAKLKGNFEGQALASWSTALRKAQEFADDEKYGLGERVIFRAVNAKGIPIHSISSITDEYEVLTSGTANYRYLNYRAIKHQEIYGTNVVTYHVFDVEEF